MSTQIYTGTAQYNLIYVYPFQFCDFHNQQGA